MILLKAATVALNVAFAGFITLLVTKAVSAWQNYTQRVENAIKQSQEAVQAADQLASSLKELENSYEELGDKSGWSSEDSDQAQDIQEQILELLKEQNGIAQDQIDQIDLQNGKYEDQLKLIRQIRLEQLRDEESDLIQNKDNQGKSLTKTARKQANDVHSVDSYDSEMAQELADKFGWSYDADAGVLNFNNYDQNDPESVAKHYDELGQAIDIITKKYSDAERASSGLYDAFKNDRAGIKDQVEAYRDSSTAIDNNISKQKELETILALTTTNARAVRGAIGTLANSIQDFDTNKLVDLLNGNGLDGLNDAQLAAIDKIKEFMTTKGFNTDQIQSFVNILSEVGFIVPQTADAVEQASQKIEDISSKIDEIQTAYKNATTAIEEYNKYGYLSADTLQTLLNEDFEYLSCLELVDGQLQVNTEKYQSMIAAQYQSAAMALVEKANAELAKIAQGEKKDAVEDATKATEDQATALTERVCPALGEFAKASMTAAAAQEFLANGDAAWSVDPERTKEVYAGLASGLDILDATVDQIMGNSDKFRQHMNGFDKETKNRNKNTAKSVTDVASAFDTLNKAMKEYNQYGYLCADTAKSLVSLDDKFTACLTKQGDKLQINVEQFRKFVKEQLKEANAAKDGGKSADEMNKILNYLDQNVDTTTISFEQLTDAIKGYGTAMDEAKEKTDAIKSAFSGLSEVSKNKIDNPFGALDAEDVDKKYQAIRDLYDNTDLFTDERFAGALNPENSEIDYNSDAFKQMFLKKLNGMATACEETGGAAGKYLAQGFRDAEDKIKNNVISIEEYINGIGSTLENINNRMDNFQSAFNDLYDVVDEYNAYGDLSQDSIQKLMALDTKYVGCLELQGDKLVFNKEAFKELYIAELKELALKYEGTDIGKRYAEILQKVADGTWDVTDHMKGMGEEANRLNTIISNLKDLFSSLLDLVNSANDKKSNDLKIQGDAWIDVIDKRIDALNEANEAQERAIELQKAEDALAKAQNNKTVRVYGENGYEWQADASAVRDAQSDLSDKRREYKKQDEIDKLNKLKDKVQEYVNLIGTSWDDYNKKLAYTAQFEAMTYDQMISNTDVFKDAVIANMKAVQAATNVSNIISKLETLIDVLTKLGNALGAFNESTSNGGLTGFMNRLSRAFSTFSDKSTGKGFLGRLWDAGKSFLGIGSGTSKQIANEVASTVGNGVSNGMVEALGGAKVNAIKEANNIFSGEGGLFSVFTNGFNKLGQLVGKATSGGGVFGAIGKFFTGIGSKVTTSVLGTSGLKTVVTAALSKIPVIGPLLIGGTIALSAIGGGNIFKGISNVVTGIGKTLAKAVKGIGKGISKAAKGIGSMLSSVFHSVVGGTSSNGKKHKGIFGWKIWPWNWGKKASGDKSIKKSGAYNVDEKGEEIIVRQPQKGRVTTLEKGDGVIPANQTETLMGIAKNPIRWLRSNLAKVTGSTAVAVGTTKDNADQEAVAQAQETAGKIDSVYSGAFSDIKKVSNAVMKSIKTGSGTIRKVIGGVTSGITGALIGFDSNKVTKSSNTLINSIKKAFDKFKNILGGSSSITGSMDKLLSSSKSKTLAQLDAMKSSFEKTWNEMAEATGVSKDDITATSKEMYDKMTKLVNDTYAAIGDNTALNSEQVEQLTQTLFKSMQSTYTSGWNRIASLTDEMTEEQANKMAIAYKSMSDGCTSTMNSVSRTMANSWNQCGGGVRNLSAKTESTISKAWADTTGDTEKMLYDMRACFDNSWGQAEQGVRNLADNTAGTINGAYTSIKSTSDETMNTKLPSDMANAWKNVEPGATNLSENIKWTMGQAYDNITKGCNDTVTSIKSAFGTAGNDLYNKGQTTDTAKTEEKKKITTTTTNSSSSSSGSSSSSQPVSGGQSLPDWFKNSFLAGAKEDYKKVKDKVTSSSAYQKASSAVNYVKDKVTSSSAYQKASSVVKDVKEKVSNSKPVKAISSFIDKHKKKASGARKINQPDIYNVDEQGSELMVRQPQAGRYTYLETGDGVVPADITSRLFEMGGNPDAWFQNQMSKYSAPVTSTGGSNLNVSMGNIVIQNPVGSADDLAGEIVRELPNKLSQYMNLR